MHKQGVENYLQGGRVKYFRYNNHLLILSGVIVVWEGEHRSASPDGMVETEASSTARAERDKALRISVDGYSKAAPLIHPQVD